MNDRSYFYDLNLPELEQLLVGWGEKTYRAHQIWQGVYQQHHSDPEKIPALPKSLRRLLSENLDFTHLEADKVLSSQDGETVKTLFRLPDQKAIEAVLMTYHTRRTLCISTQAGCAMGCQFCATGQMGFKRNLSSGEIVEQVLYYARQLYAKGESVTNVVMMGMGEPFHNYDETMAAISRLNHPQGLNLGARRFTISTVGLVPYIRRFTNENRQVNLAISLHAADDVLRNSLMPINKKYPLSELADACRNYIDKTHRRITFEWALIKGVNDTTEQANRLAAWLKGMLCHVNVIPLNPTPGYEGKPTSVKNAQHFCAILEEHGIPCTIRVRRGIEIQAGCGQLATQEKD
jgi:23S rRNA (adenine2503-C2)-methyltransferase